MNEQAISEIFFEDVCAVDPAAEPMRTSCWRGLRPVTWSPSSNRSASARCFGIWTRSKRSLSEVPSISSIVRRSRRANSSRCAAGQANCASGRQRSPSRPLTNTNSSAKGRLPSSPLRARQSKSGSHESSESDEACVTLSLLKESHVATLKCDMPTRPHVPPRSREGSEPPRESRRLVGVSHAVAGDSAI